jgi:hypothetical protein
MVERLLLGRLSDFCWIECKLHTHQFCRVRTHTLRQSSQINPWNTNHDLDSYVFYRSAHREGNLQNEKESFYRNLLVASAPRSNHIPNPFGVYGVNNLAERRYINKAKTNKQTNKTHGEGQDTFLSA